MNKLKRHEISLDTIEEVQTKVKAQLLKCLRQKGFGAFTSSHEVLGVLEEEFCELKDAIRDNNIKNVKEELFDIAVGAIFSLACIEEDTLKQL